MGFFSDKKQQDKAFARNLKRWLCGRQYTDTQVGLFISSALSHIFIEIDHGHLEYYDQYMVSTQAKKLSEFVAGDLEQPELIKFYRQLVGEEFGCLDPSTKVE